jgi:hypothetical protein
MVDALHEAHRILVERGVFVDARPDSRVSSRVHAGSPGGRVVGTIGTQRATKVDDQRSDRAVRAVLREKLFRSRRRGRLSHAIPFENSAELSDYLRDHLRLSRRVRWTAPAARRAGPLFVERTVRFEILEKTSDERSTRGERVRQP